MIGRDAKYATHWLAKCVLDLSTLGDLNGIITIKTGLL